MASDLSDLAWASKANEVRSRLPDADVDRNDLGEAIVARLLTFGPFYQRLADERRHDGIARAIQDAGAPVTQPTTATLTIGGLRLTAGLPGASGNGISVTVSPGTATTFRPTTIDQAASQRQLGFAVQSLSGAIPYLSPDPEVAALQQQTAAFLASLDDTTRAEAEQIIRDRWDDSRVARGDLTPPRIRDATAQALHDVGLDDGQVTSTMATYDAVEQAKAVGAASAFTLSVQNGAAVETFTDIVAGYDFALRGSVLIASFEWVSSERPADGSYQFTDGTDGAAPAGSKLAERAASEYVFRLDAFRSYTLPELEKIVADTIDAADRWIG